MTVSSSTSQTEFSGNGVTTVFPLPFRFFINEDIDVSLIDNATGLVTLQTIGVNYSLSGAGQPEVDGSAVSVLTMNVAPAAGFTLLVERIMAVTQPTDIVNQGRFFPNIHETVFDRITMLIQQNATGLDRALRWPAGSGASGLLPVPVPGKVLQVNSEGDGVDLVDYVPAVAPGSWPILSNIATLKSQDKNAVTRAFVQGYYAAGDGGGGHYYLDTTDVVSADNGGTIIVALDGGRWKLTATGIISVRQFGAKPDNLTDAAPAINASLLALGYAYIPQGTYRIATTVNVATGNRIWGAGRPATTINSITSSHSFLVAANAEYWSIKSLRLTRPLGDYGNTAGKDGIRCAGYVQLAHIDDIEIFRHWRGMSLGPTSYSFVSNYLIDNNYEDGIHVEGTASIGAMQWTFFKGISQRNNGCGMKFQTVAGPTTASMGDLVSVSTYGNKIDGIAWVGIPSCPINAIRVRGAFVGEEGRHGIHMDTYGVSTHTLADVFSEICGTLPCGVDGTTPATNQGRGFNITANQQEVIMTGCNAIGNSWSGLVSQCPRLTVTGGSYRLNGAALLVGERNGIQLEAGSGSVTGLRANGNKAYGVFLQNDNHQIVGCNLLENVTSAIGAAVALSITIDSANRKT